MRTDHPRSNSVAVILWQYSVAVIPQQLYRGIRGCVVVLLQAIVGDWEG